MFNMTQEEIIETFCLQEKKLGCYDIRIKGIPVYNLIKRTVRAVILEKNGFSFKEGQVSGSVVHRLQAILLSFVHLIRLRQNRFRYLFFTFRLENINGVWLDKFYDPIIDECGMNPDDYVILETNRGRMHSERLHGDHVFYDDSIALIAYVLSYVLYPYYLVKYNCQFYELKRVLSSLIQCQSFNKYYFSIVRNIIRISLYRNLLVKSHPECIIAASRSNFAPLLCAAKMENVRFVELQHGISYGPTVTYGGFQDPLFTPDRFLTFGDIWLKSVYGINEECISTCGWAFKNYLQRQVAAVHSSDEKNVLVLSQNQSTDYILDCLVKLASENPEIVFHLRCHPMERLTAKQTELIGRYSNIVIQDKSLAFLVAINSFELVVGENSTAVYEAMSYGKRTGILAFNGHSPKFLSEIDRNCFWIIDSVSSFRDYLVSDKSSKEIRSIYSKFDKNVLFHAVNN